MWNHRSPWGRSVVVAPKWLSYSRQMGPFGGRTGAKSIDESLWGLLSSTFPSCLLQQRSSSQEAVPFCLLRFLHFAGHLGFPGSSVGKESTCNEGDPSWIPELGRSLGEGIGYPLQYSWASLVAQLVRIRLQCWTPGFDPWVGKVPWRRERLPTPVLAWRIPWTTVHGLSNSRTWLNECLSLHSIFNTSLKTKSFHSAILKKYPLSTPQIFASLFLHFDCPAS